MKSKDYKWTAEDKESKEYARTHFCYYPDKDKCDIMNKCDLYKCDTSKFKLKISGLGCVSSPSFLSGHTEVLRKVNEPAAIETGFSNSCGAGHTYPNQEFKGWVIGGDVPDISTAEGMATYMTSYTPEGTVETSNNIIATADILRTFNVQTTGDCAGNIEYGVLNVFPYVSYLPCC